MPNEQPVYEQMTDGIRISVAPEFLDEESVPSENHYVWAYTVRIDNLSQRMVSLRRRQWNITDASGNTVVVSGDGVVGEQPVLYPGDAFEYTSGCPLTTPSGMMVGSYAMENESGEEFEVPIPAFSLDSPFGIQRPN